MRRALGRLLGLFLTLLLTSVAAIAAFSALGAGPRKLASEGPELPLYVNRQPRNVHDLARSAVRRIVENRDAETARHELVRLGGAALPHVLPELDTLSPLARGRVAVALVPVAERMAVAQDEDLSNPALAVAFWARFWQDRAFDFRPQVARRLVSRLAEKSYALRHEDIVHLDTYCLPELIRALGKIRTQDDVLRAERLTSVLAHVTGRNAKVQNGMRIEEAARRVADWRRFYAEQGADFTTLDGPNRIVAMFVQTRYGRWVGSLVGVARSRAEMPRAVFGMPASSARQSALRLLAVLLIAFGVGSIWAQRELASRGRGRFGYQIAAAGATAIPISYVSGLFVLPLGTVARQLVACALAGLLGAAWLSRAALAQLRDASGERLRLAVASGALLRSLPSTVGWVLTALLALEVGFELDGAGVTALAALDAGELGPPMALALGGAVCAAISVAVADIALAVSSPRFRQPSLIEVGGRARTRLALWAALTACLLALVGAGGTSQASTEVGWSQVAEGVRSLIGYASLTGLVALGLGCCFGALAASGPRTFDGLLARLLEVADALPTVLWAAAFYHALGGGILLAVALGALRGLDVAWLLRTELLRRERLDAEYGGRSLGRFPLRAFLRGRLRPALFPARSALALTPAWLLAIGATGQLCGLDAAAGPPGWHALLARDFDVHALPSLGAVVLATIVTGTLLSVLSSPPRRLGALRSVPPPASGVAASELLQHKPKSES